VPTSDDYCPVARSVEVLGDRWCLLLVREMLRGVDRFNELERSVPGISRSVLAQRLRHLEREGVVDRRVGADGRSTDYRLTDAGYELGAVVGALNDWGVRWRVPDGGPPDLEPDGLMLWVRRHVALDQLPARRVVIGFRLRARAGAPTGWSSSPGRSRSARAPRLRGAPLDQRRGDHPVPRLPGQDRAVGGDGRRRAGGRRAAVHGPGPTALVPPPSLTRRRGRWGRCWRSCGRRWPGPSGP